jgi:hypothetical protein
MSELDCMVERREGAIMSLERAISVDRLQALKLRPSKRAGSSLSEEHDVKNETPNDGPQTLLLRIQLDDLNLSIAQKQRDYDEQGLMLDKRAAISSTKVVGYFLKLTDDAIDRRISKVYGNDPDVEVKESHTLSSDTHNPMHAVHNMDAQNTCTSRVLELTVQSRNKEEGRLPHSGAVIDLCQSELKKQDITSRNNALDGANTDKAFVTFSTVTSAIIACEVIHSAPGYRQTFRVQEAPDTKLDLFWPSLNKSPITVIGLKMLTDTLTFGLVVFFAFPVAFMNRKIGPDVMVKYALAHNWPWYLKSVCSQALPMTLVIVSNLLPPLFTGLGFLEGSLTWSTNGLRQLDRMFYFLLINVFCVAVIIENTIIDSILGLFHDPAASISSEHHLICPHLSFFTSGK